MFYVVYWSVEGDGNGGADTWLAGYNRCQDEAYARELARRKAEDFGGLVLSENFERVAGYGVTDFEGAVKYLKEQVANGR